MQRKPVYMCKVRNEVSDFGSSDFWSTFQYYEFVEADAFGYKTNKHFGKEKVGPGGMA